MKDNTQNNTQFWNSIIFSDLDSLKKEISQGVSLTQRHNGLTPLDVALIYNQSEVISLLRNHAVSTSLTAEEIIEARQRLFRESHLKTRVVIQVAYDQHQRPSLEVESYHYPENELITRTTLPFEFINQIGSVQNNLRVISFNNAPHIGLYEANDPSKLVALFNMSSMGELTLVAANSKSTVMAIKTTGHAKVQGEVELNELHVKARSIATSVNSKIQLNIAKLVSENNIVLNGQFYAGDFNIESGSFENNGQTIATQSFEIDSKTRVEQKGILVTGKNGKIKAHYIQNHSNALLQAQDGNLQLHGEAFVGNSGSIQGNHLVLDSAVLINNYAGALIKAETCVIPPGPNQFNNAGFFIIGRKNKLSVFDQILNWSSAGTEIAGILSLAPIQAVKNLRMGILVGKTLYRAGTILQKLHAGNAHEISASEMVNFFLDYVVPSMGSISGNEQKSRFFCSMLYQVWGWYLGEQALIEKSLSLIEMLVRGTALLSEGRLKAEDIQLLEDLAAKIQFSKHAAKYIRSAVQIASASLSTDDSEKVNAKDTFLAISESVLRNFLHTLKPENIFDVELNPKELALYVLNKGYQQSLEMNVKRAVYAFLYTMHKSGKVGDESKADFQFLIHMMFSGIAWAKLKQRYKKGEISFSELMDQVLSLISILSSYKLTKDQFAKKNQSIAETQIDQTILDEVEKDDNKQEVVISEENTDSNLVIEQNQDESLTSDEISIPTIQSEDEIEETIEKNAESFFVEYEKQHIDVVYNLVDQVEGELIKNSTKAPAELEVETQISLICQEIQRALDGDNAAEGYLGVFANTLHNEGILDTVGSIQFSLESGRNANSIRATRDIDLYGTDIANRDEKGKVVNRDLSQNASLSTFVNEEQGLFYSRQSVHSTNVGSVDNLGSLQADDDIRITSKKFKNHQDASVFSKNEDVVILADSTAENEGMLSGFRTVLEGSSTAATNSGTMFAQDLAVMASEQEVNVKNEGNIIGNRVHLKGRKISKEGSLHSTFVKTSGYDVEKPEAIDWHKADDKIHALLLNPRDSFVYGSDAFNTTNIVDLQLGHDQLGDGTLLDISSEFQGTLQLQLPESTRVFVPQELPIIGSEAALSLIAPGSTLDATSSAPFDYQSAFTFSGDTFSHSGEATFSEGYFDTRNFEMTGGETQLSLKNGGFIQSENFLNEGHVSSGGLIQWNVEHFDNNAQLEFFNQTFIHSKQTGVQDTNTASKVVENSGTITASGHLGYIGEFNQCGGSFTSGSEGNTLFIRESNQKPIWTQTGEYTRGVVEDIGMSWHQTPESHNSIIGSDGDNVLLGTGKFTSTGVTLYGGTGNHVHFNEGIVEENESVTYQIQKAYEKKHGKKGKQTVTDSLVTVISHNQISCDEPDNMTLASANSSIILNATTISTPGNVALVAKDKVYIGGKEITESHFSDYKTGYLHRKHVTSNTEITHIECSNLLIGGTLAVSCIDFQLSAVKGVIGNVDIIALNTTLNGKKEHYRNTTTTKEFKLGLPIDSLVGLLSDNNANTIFSTLVENCGWSLGDLHAFANSNNPAELPLNLLSSAQGVWNLTALTAHVCNNVAEGSVSDPLGLMTDKLGLTMLNSDGKRIANTNVSLTWSKKTEHAEQSSFVSTGLYIGGTFKLVGSTLQILDGSKIDAKTLLISLSKGIEMTCGVKTVNYSSSMKNVSFGVNVLNPEEVDLSAGKGKSNIYSETATLASLNARESANIQAGEYIAGQGKITAATGSVVAPTVSLTSVQDKYTETSNSSGFNVSTTLSTPDKIAQQGNFSAHYTNKKIDTLTTSDKAGIFLKNGELSTNQCHLGNGSKIEVSELHRLDDDEGLPSVTSSDAYDHSYTSQTGGAIKSLSSQPGINIQKNKSEEVNVQHASIYADNVSGSDFSGINTDRARETETVKSKKSEFKFDSKSFDPKKIKSQAEEILKAGNHASDFVTDLFSESSKPLHFSFTKPKKPSVPPPFPQGQPSIDTDDLAVSHFNSTYLPAADSAFEIPLSSSESKVSSTVTGSSAEDEITQPSTLIYPSSSNVDKPIAEYKDGKLNILIDYPAQQEEKPKSILSFEHEPFRLPSALPDSHDDPALNYLFAIARGIESARDATADRLIHPIDTMANMAISAFDGWNSIADLTIGYSTEGARERNRERGIAFHDSVEAVTNANSVQMTEMLSSALTDAILGGATDRMATKYGAAAGKRMTKEVVDKAVGPLMEKFGHAVETPHGYALQSYTPAALIKRRQAKNEASLYRVGNTDALEKNNLSKSDGQFWAFKPAIKNDHADKHGIPPKNASSIDFCTEGKLKPGSTVITRPAPGIGVNRGGEIEAVVAPGNVSIVNESVPYVSQKNGSPPLIGILGLSTTLGSLYAIEEEKDSSAVMKLRS